MKGWFINFDHCLACRSSSDFLPKSAGTWRGQVLLSNLIHTDVITMSIWWWSSHSGGLKNLTEGYSLCRNKGGPIRDEKPILPWNQVLWSDSSPYCFQTKNESTPVEDLSKMGKVGCFIPSSYCANVPCKRSVKWQPWYCCCHFTELDDWVIRYTLAASSRGGGCPGTKSGMMLSTFQGDRRAVQLSYTVQ